LTHNESNTDKTANYVHVLNFIYEKAFDSVPHTLALEVLCIYKINPIIKRFLGITMQNWQNSISLRMGQRSIKTSPIKIQRKIFQRSPFGAL
jgi:hypothetical protein